MSDLVSIGRIRGLAGKDGWVSVEAFTDFPERFYDLTRVFAAPDQKEEFPLPLKIDGVQVSHSRVELSFVGIADVDKAKSLKGHYLLVAAKDRIELPQDQYYLDDLKGLAVYTRHGVRVGVVKEAMANPGNDLLVIVRAGSSREMLLPMVKEFVHDVDLKEGRITVTIPEGLEEI